MDPGFKFPPVQSYRRHFFIFFTFTFKPPCWIFWHSDGPVNLLINIFNKFIPKLVFSQLIIKKIYSGTFFLEKNSQIERKSEFWKRNAKG